MSASSGLNVCVPNLNFKRSACLFQSLAEARSNTIRNPIRHFFSANWKLPTGRPISGSRVRCCIWVHPPKKIDGRCESSSPRAWIRAQAESDRTSKGGIPEATSTIVAGDWKWYVQPCAWIMATRKNKQNRAWAVSNGSSELSQSAWFFSLLPSLLTYSIHNLLTYFPLQS